MFSWKIGCMASLLYISISLQAAYCAQRAIKPPASHSGPVVIIMACQNYTELPPLKHTIDSAISLAKALQAIGYRVTIISETGSLKQLKDAMPALPAEAFLPASTGSEIGNHIDAWLDMHFRKTDKPACFGFCVFTGHGEDRELSVGSEICFMGCNDLPGEAGLSLNKLKADIGRARLPLVLIVDTCRTPSSRQSVRGPSDDPVEQARGNRFRFGNAKGGMEDPGNISPVTTFWATQEGQPAADAERRDLLSVLADGLQPTSKQKTTFKAREFRGLINGPDLGNISPLENDTDLSLLTWFNFAVVSIAGSHENQQVCQVDPGYVDQIMICASHKQKFEYSSPPINLLSQWGEFAKPGLEGEPSKDGRCIRRPVDARVGKMSASAFFDDPLDWKGKTLVVELIAKHANAAPGSALKYLIQPGNARPPGSYLSADWDRSRSLLYGVTSVVGVPLVGEPLQEFRSLAFSVAPGQEAAWPTDASLTVTRMILVDNKTGAVLGAPPARLPTIDMLSRWWMSDVIPGEASVDMPVRITCEREILPGKQRLLRIGIDGAANGTLAGKGGPLYQSPHVDKKLYQLVVQVKSIMPVLTAKEKNRGVTLSLRSGNAHLVNATLSNGDGLQKFPLSESGIPDYMSITGDGVSEVKISGVRLEPRTK